MHWTRLIRKKSSAKADFFFSGYNDARGVIYERVLLLCGPKEDVNSISQTRQFRLLEPLSATSPVASTVIENVRSDHSSGHILRDWNIEFSTKKVMAPTEENAQSLIVDSRERKKKPCATASHRNAREEQRERAHTHFAIGQTYEKRRQHHCRSVGSAESFRCASV